MSAWCAVVTDRTGSKMGISPLMLAAMNGHTAAVKLLLDMGSDVNAQVCIFTCGGSVGAFTLLVWHQEEHPACNKLIHAVLA